MLTIDATTWQKLPFVMLHVMTEAFINQKLIYTDPQLFVGTQKI